MRPLIVVSDLHLGHRRCDNVAADMARLIEAHPGHEVILNGDTFNLGCDQPGRDPAASAAAMLSAHPVLVRAMAAHLAAGGEITMVCGNHDPELRGPLARQALIAALGADEGVCLTLEPWIVQRGALHIEHGHLYDPSNSPTHPLVVPTAQSEPVGMKLTRRFVGRYEAWDLFADSFSAGTAERMRRMHERFGIWTTLATLDYLRLLAVVNAEILLRGRPAAERATGDRAMASYASGLRPDPAALGALIDGRDSPMHFRFWATFLRFGFDAMIALLAMPAGLIAAWWLHRLWPIALSVVGGLYLVAAQKSLAARGQNQMPAELRRGAALVKRRLGVSLVILGHTHIADEAEGYLNLGAFGDRPTTGDRGYVHVDEQGRAERRVMPAT